MINFYEIFPLKNTLKGRMVPWESHTGKQQSQNDGEHPCMERARTHQSGCFLEGGEANNFGYTLCARHWIGEFKFMQSS